jgi:hypothetical protein
MQDKQAVQQGSLSLKRKLGGLGMELHGNQR